MKQIIFSSIIFLMASAAWSQDLLCQISLNEQVVYTSNVHTTVGEKTPAGKTADAVAYVTEKENQNFTIEAFLPDYEARIYGQGTMAKSTDNLSTSYWGRDSMIDISCHPVK